MRTSVLKGLAVLLCMLTLFVFSALAAAPRKEPRDIKMSSKIRKPVKLVIMGIYDHRPTELVIAMAPRFVEHAKREYGYEASVAVDAVPFTLLFDEVSRNMKSQPQKYNLIIADSQLLGALAETGWIVQVNRLIERFQELNVEWNDPVGAAGSGDSPAGETPSSSS